MSTATAFIGTRAFRRYLYGSVGLIVLLALVFRNSGLYVVVVDETLYSRFSRLLPLSDSEVPGYLYLWLYSATNVCGDDFLSCARLLNVVVFLAAAPFIYMSAKRTCGRTVAAVVTLLALAGPINVYTAYFMPEAMYFLCFWVLTWYAWGMGHRSSTMRSFALLGGLFGLCALVKPHAILFAPALLAFALIIAPKQDGIRTSELLRWIATFLACGLALKFGVSYALAGRAGLTLMGKAYGHMASSGLASLSYYFEILTTAAGVAYGHLLALAQMFGMPIAAAVSVVLLSIVRREDKPATQTALYSTLILGCLVVVVALFTATVPYSDSNQAVNRLHMRYYNFALPLLLIVAAAFVHRGGHEVPIAWRAPVAVPVGLFAAYGLFGGLNAYESSYVDSPELRGFVLDGQYFSWLTAMSIAALIAWIVNARLGARLYLFVYAPLFVLLASVAVNKDLGQRKTPDIYDRAGIVAKSYLPDDEDVSKLIVVGSDAAGLMRTAMYLDNPGLLLKEVPPGTRIDPADLPEDREWVLAVGDTALINQSQLEVSTDDFALVRVVESATLSFSKTAWPGVVSKAEGLSTAETWGTWSSGKVVKFAFKRPLPARFAVHLKGRAFASPPYDEFIMHAGTASKGFALKEGVVDEVVLEFDNPSRSNLIKIDVPHPLSPRERGMGADDRLLGIAFYELRVEPL